MRFFNWLISTAMLLNSASSLGEAPNCQAIFRLAAEKRSLSFETEAPKLTWLQSQKTRFGNSDQVNRSNRETVRTFADYVPEMTSKGGRGSEVEYSQLQKLLDVLKDHPVVGPTNRDRYQRENVEIGYCFGRALYVQLMLLKMGLNPDSIRKVWLVGPQKNPNGENWGFHVATAAYVKGFGWMAIDTNTFKIQPIRHWYSSFYENSIDGMARFYVTDAKRFTADISKISKKQLGLDLTVDKDWYRHYFVDMVSSVRDANISALGLQSVPRSAGHETKTKESGKAPSLFSGVRDFFGF